MNFKTYSGDWYLIPEGQESEAKEYQQALKSGDESVMLKFEEGETGWQYLPEFPQN